MRLNCSFHSERHSRASGRETSKDTDSHAFFIYPNANEERPEALKASMHKTLEEALSLVNAYNQKYNTSFEADRLYELFPVGDGKYGFKENSWPCNGKAGVYLILDENKNIIYVGQSSSLSYRFYQYFKDEDGVCVVRSSYWTATPHFIVAIAAPDDAKYERLSLEEYLIERLQPSDNTRGK